jgi:hypothetical protein
MRASRAARATEAGQAAVEDAAQRAALARQREEAASAMQRSLESLADAFKRFDALGRRIEGKLTRGISRRAGEIDFDLLANHRRAACVPYWWPPG